jgi:hypothetical protein
MKKLQISIDETMCCCNSCLAQNYDGDGLGKRTDTIYKILAGQTAIHLCPDCLRELKKSINELL